MWYNDTMWTKTKTTELDVAYDDTLEDALATIPADIKVTYRVTVANGPGGGWPVIEFHGTSADLERLVREWYSPDDSEHADFLLGVDVT